MGKVIPFPVEPWENQYSQTPMPTPNAGGEIYAQCRIDWEDAKLRIRRSIDKVISKPNDRDM